MGPEDLPLSKKTNSLTATPSPKAHGKTLLSTKKLRPENRALLENTGIAVSDYEAIRIKFLKISIPQGYDHLIFSSKNGVKACLKSLRNQNSRQKYAENGCFCVGPKTRALLEKNGWQVLRMENSAKELARYLIEKYSDKSFLFVCGDKRREDLPGLLNAHGLPITELVGYETRINAIKVEDSYDAVLFFSPSGVQSFFTHNTLDNAVAYCIGPTTAREVSKHTNRYKIAPAPEIARVIQLALDDLAAPGKVETKRLKKN